MRNFYRTFVQSSDQISSEAQKGAEALQLPISRSDMSTPTIDKPSAIFTLKGYEDHCGACNFVCSSYLEDFT